MGDKILSILENQLNQRLEKLWQIFSWCSSLLISITGAVIVAGRARDKPLFVFPYDQIIISVIILVITVYAWRWLNENLRFESFIRDQMEKLITEELGYPEFRKIRPDKKARFGYKDVIILLGLVAIAATWIVA